MDEMINILERRGFFIEKKEERYFLSDNADKDDAKYLAEILQKYNIGYLLKDNEIILTKLDTHAINEMFMLETEEIEGEAFKHNLGWWTVQKREYSYKCPVRILESNVSRYVKALNAAGIFTWCSCDGNHHGKNKLIVSFDEPGYMEFIRQIWIEWISKKFKLNWQKNKEGSVLLFEENNRKYQYDVLNEAAKYIYEHRDIIRKIRMESMAWMTNSNRRHMKDIDIKKRFMSEVVDRLKRVDL